MLFSKISVTNKYLDYTNTKYPLLTTDFLIDKITLAGIWSSLVPFGEWVLHFFPLKLGRGCSFIKLPGNNSETISTLGSVSEQTFTLTFQSMLELEPWCRLPGRLSTSIVCMNIILMISTLTVYIQNLNLHNWKIASRRVKQIEREWENEEKMEREWGNGERFTLYISSFSLYFLPLYPFPIYPILSHFVAKC